MTVMHGFNVHNPAAEPKSISLGEFSFGFDHLDCDLRHNPCATWLSLNDARTMADIWRVAFDHVCPAD